MASLKDLRRRIRSTNNIKTITRAMRSVATTKMRRTQDRRTKAKPYVDRLRNLVARIVRSVGSEGQPLLEKRESENKLVVVFSSDRGLCGAFNTNILRFAENYLNENPSVNDLYVVGKKAETYFRKRGYNIIQSQLDFRGNIDVPRILEIARELKDLFLQRNCDQIELIYNWAASSMASRPKRDLFLPLDPNELADVKAEGDEEEETLQYIFEPDPKTLLSHLLPKFVETKLLFVFIDTFVAEHQARMLAMKNANDNCNELLDSLTLQMNKERQAAITKEILEIVGGAEALKG